MIATLQADQHIDRDAWSFALLAFVYTLAWNWQHHGPAYLSDEVAYLVNAAILAGHHVDAMGSWHAGYSMLLWPLFLLDDPALVWRYLLTVNAGLVAASLLIAARLILDFEPQVGRNVRRIILLLVVLYPSYSAIAGYAFSSSLLTLLVLALFRMVLLSDRREWGFHFGLAVLLGVTYWVHPIGVVFSVAAALAHAFTYWGTRQARFAVLLLAVPAFMAVLYKLGIHEWMYDRVTPDNLQRYDHYGALTDRAVDSWFDRSGRIALLMLGQLSYQVIASFGVVAIAAWSVFRLARQRLLGVEFLPPGVSAGLLCALLFSMLSLLGVAAAGAWTISWVIETRIDHWVYGRYTDAMVLPLLVFGYVLVFRRAHACPWLLLVLLAAGVVAVGAGLAIFADPGPAHSRQQTLAFWPQVFWPDAGYLAWFLLGAAGGVVVLATCRIAGVAWKAVVMTGLAALVAGGLGVANFRDHQSLLSGYSKPSAVMDIVRADWPRGTCVGFMHPLPEHLSLMQRERYRLYAFYLFNYDYRRQTVEQWRTTCDGPLFSYAPRFALNDPTLDILAREVDTGLYLIARTRDRDVETEGSVGLVSHRGGVLLGSEVGKACLIAGCFSQRAVDLANASQVGALDVSGMQLVSDGRAGFLFYGPYWPLEAGSYRVRLQGDFGKLAGVTLDVVSHGGKTIHASRNLDVDGPASDQPTLEFELSDRVETLEVRMRVGPGSSVAVAGYQVELLPD